MYWAELLRHRSPSRLRLDRCPCPGALFAPQMQGMIMLHDDQLRQLPGHPAQGLPPEAGGLLGAQQQQQQHGEELYSELQYQAHLRTTMGPG